MCEDLSTGLLKKLGKNSEDARFKKKAFLYEQKCCQVFFNIQNGTQALLLAPKWNKIS